MSGPFPFLQPIFHIYAGTVIWYGHDDCTCVERDRFGGEVAFSNIESFAFPSVCRVFTHTRINSVSCYFLITPSDLLEPLKMSEPLSSLKSFKLLCFDCYGTIIVRHLPNLIKNPTKRLMSSTGLGERNQRLSDTSSSSILQKQVMG